MRRTLIVLLMAVAAVVVLLLTVSEMTERRLSQAAPLAQVPETEPNNSCSQANEIDLAEPVQGIITTTDVTDWFSVTTVSGQPYIASASVGPADFKVRLCVYADCNYMFCSSASQSYVEKSFNATGNRHSIKIEKYDSVPTGTASYVLEVVGQYATPTPSETPTPTPTPPPSVTEKDNYEDHDGYSNNNSKEKAYELPVSTLVTLSSLEGVANFYPDKSDEDWYRIWAKDDKWYKVTTSELSGVDTYVVVYDKDGDKKESDDDGAGGYASTVTWKAKYDGWYYICVTNKVNTAGTYNMTVEESSEPPETPTPTPVSPSGDTCENNHDFEHACIIAADKAYTFNLVPPYPNGSDSDYFKLWVKSGFIYECQTSNLAPGVDPNMILWSGPSDSPETLIGGNDDRDKEAGDINSYFAYYATYEGWMYILIGTGDRTPPDVSNSNYTLECKMQVPGQPTATPSPTPLPGKGTDDGETPSAPVATATPVPGLTIRPLTTPAPPPPPTPPSPQFVPVSLLVYYDGNGDGQPGAGEGIAGISAQAYEAATNQLLAQGFTDEQGGLQFTVAAQGPVRVRVPFFGFSQLVAGEGASLYLRVPPQPLPEGAP
jgi:hypothetical protein